MNPYVDVGWCDGSAGSGGETRVGVALLQTQHVGDVLPLRPAKHTANNTTY